MPQRRKLSIARRASRALLLLILVLACASTVTVLVLRYADPPTTAFMLRDRVLAHGSKPGNRIRQQWVPWVAISPHARLAVVAAEDQKFPDHGGFDVDSIRAAIVSHLSSDGDAARLRGASTISQQVAKNLFLWPERSWVRKVLEAGFTLLIEALWPKRRILEVYLNIAQFGDGVYGVEAAARAYFGKTAAEITADEAALMATVLPNPVRFQMARPSTYMRERQGWIRRQMSQLGGIGYLDRI